MVRNDAQAQEEGKMKGSHHLAWNLGGLLAAHGLRVADLVREARRLGYRMDYAHIRRLARRSPSRIGLSTLEGVLAALRSLTGKDIGVDDLLLKHPGNADPPGGQTFAQRLRMVREARGLSRRELAERAGLSSSALSLLERGKRRPTYPTLRALAEALEVEPEDLLGPRGGYLEAAGVAPR